MGNSAHKKSNDTNKNKNQEYKPSHLKLLLISGYIRNHARYYIAEINKICFIYYGAYAAHLAYIEDHDDWFKNIKNNIDIFKYSNTRRLKITPITQYVDNRYQIVFCSINKFSWIDWKCFLLIDMNTNEVHKLIWNKTKYDSADEIIYFQLLMSKPLELRSIQTDINGNKYAVLDYFGSSNQWLKLKNDVNTIYDGGIAIDAIVSEDGTEIEFYQYERWKQFESNLWDLFVLDILYNPKKKIEKQQIWKVIQFLSLIYFEPNQCSQTRIHLTIPQLIININEYKKVCSEILEMKNSEIIRHLVNDTTNIDNDICAKIIEYVKGKLFKCKCYLAANWGGGFATSGGFDKNIYCATFQMEKKFDKIDIQLDFQCIMTHYREGDELS